MLSFLGEILFLGVVVLIVMSPLGGTARSGALGQQATADAAEKESPK